MRSVHEKCSGLVDMTLWSSKGEFYPLESSIKDYYLSWNQPWLSPPVHIVLILLLCITFCPFFRPSLENNPYLGKYYSYESETLPQYEGLIGAYRKNTYL